MGKYYGIPMHMHSCWERNASMEGHMYQLEQLGLKYIYLTDHDVRMGRRKYHPQQFDFSRGELYFEDAPGLSSGFQNLVGSVEMTPQKELRILAKSDSAEWSVSSATYDSQVKRHELAFLSNLILHLGMGMTQPDEDIRIVVDVEGSMRPPEFENGHILYVFGNCDGLEDDYHTVIPLRADKERYDFDLSKDAQKVGGGDNVLKTITFSVACRNGKSAELYLNHLSTSWDYTFEEGRIKQQEIADKLGQKYGVTPFVTTEISNAGRHKNCFSTKVPIIDYEALGYEVSEEYAIRHVVSHGGIFSINHPFEPYKTLMKEQPERKEEFYRTVLSDYLSNRGLGATLMEVGFPMGRSGFTFEDHLTLWDTLALDGIILTAYGDSDTHGKLGFFNHNNFVGYIYAEEPGEEAFVQSMKAGNMYTGDPVYLEKMTVSFTGGENHPMGSVIFSDRPIPAKLSIEGIGKEMTLIWNVNGKNLEPVNVTADYRGEVEIPNEGKVNFARAALYDGERCIMMTNPVYTTWDKGFFGGVPKERSVAK